MNKEVLVKATAQINQLKKENGLLKQKLVTPIHFDVMNGHLFWLALAAKISIIYFVISLFYLHKQFSSITI